jgi:hypothetical protein
MTKRKITVTTDKGMREPRRGELNYEIKRILVKHCTRGNLKAALKSVEIAVSRLAPKFGVEEFTVMYDRMSNKRRNTKSWDADAKSWICDSIVVNMFRIRTNGTTAIHRAGASMYPHFFGENERFANLSAPRDLTIFYSIDDLYSWRGICLKPRPSLLARQMEARGVQDRLISLEAWPSG